MTLDNHLEEVAVSLLQMGLMEFLVPLILGTLSQAQPSTVVLSGAILMVMLGNHLFKDLNMSEEV